MEVGNIIREQIGHKAFTMLGAHSLTVDTNCLIFKIRGSRKVTAIKVSLEPSDTYKMEFFKVAKLSVKKVAEYEGVYVDMLHSLIEKETGLYTSL